MLTPEGTSADKIDKIMLLAMWTNVILRASNEESTKVAAQNLQIRPRIIAAGMGKPTYPLHPFTREFLRNYWNLHSGSAIDYGHPQGDIEARRIMAQGMSKWYNVPIASEDILFTVGGAGALKSIFSALKNQNKDAPNFRVITPSPYYTLYADNDLNLHFVPVMKEKGYRLTAEGLRASIHAANKLAKKDGGAPRAILICDPNNPLGTVLGREELEKIAQVLRENPELTIVIDEAYAEMVLDGQHVSLLTVAPDLKERMIVMRSATKGLSAAGERMAITMAFNKDIMSNILEHNIRNYGHAPRSAQITYAETMNAFTEEDRIKIMNFYRPKIEFVSKRVAELGAAMPDKDYKVEGTFYVLLDLSDLIGLPLSENTFQALGKRGNITSDEDITYSLLFNESVMIAPLSYYGIPKEQGLMRITCSGEQEDLLQLMSRIEARLTEARLIKKQTLSKQLQEQLLVLKELHPKKYKETTEQLNIINDAGPRTCLQLKNEITQLNSLLLDTKRLITQSTLKGQIAAATKIQSQFRGHLARKETKQLRELMDKEWNSFVDQFAPESGSVRTSLQKLPLAERSSFAPWKQYMQEKNGQAISPTFFMQIMSSPTLTYLGGLLLIAGLAAIMIGTFGGASIPVALALAGAGSSVAGGTALGAQRFFTKEHLSNLNERSSIDRSSNLDDEIEEPDNKGPILNS